jgi:hypothetical protein
MFKESDARCKTHTLHNNKNKTTKSTASFDGDDTNFLGAADLAIYPLGDDGVGLSAEPDSVLAVDLAMDPDAELDVGLEAGFDVGVVYDLDVGYETLDELVGMSREVFGVAEPGAGTVRGRRVVRMVVGE